MMRYVMKEIAEREKTRMFASAWRCARQRSATMLIVSGVVLAQTGATDEQPSQRLSAVGNWPRCPPGVWGAAAGVDIDRTARASGWPNVAGRISCAGSNFDPILKFDASGKLVKAFGHGMFVFPHGINVDREGNVWVTDGQGKDGMGHQ